MKKINKLLKSVLNKVYGSQGEMVSNLMANWGDIVGKEFLNYSYPYRITSYMMLGNKKIHVLHIRVKSSAIATQILYSEDIITERIAVFLGTRSINKIRIQIYSN